MKVQKETYRMIFARAVLGVLALFVLGCQSHMSSDDYLGWVESYENGLHKRQQVGDFLIDIQYKPIVYNILRSNNPEEIEALKTHSVEQESALEFTLSLGLSQKGIDLLDFLSSNQRERQELIYYFSYQMNEDVYLEIDGQKTPCGLWHFERSFDLKNHRTFVMAFDRSQNTLSEITLVIDSPLFAPYLLKRKLIWKIFLNIESENSTDIMRKKRKIIALVLLQTMFLQIFEIPVAYALTSGPSQPEVQSFEPASTTEMVDLFTGDFTYNIPLFELPGPNGGYPFNIAYHAGIGMDQEASWVGLGWSLNPGSITRQMRGLPDDFSGDEVVTTLKMKPSTTVGVGAGAGTEIFGGAGLELNLSVRYNNYKGIGYSIGGDLGFNQAIKQSPTSASLGLGLSLDSQEGLSLTPSMSLGTQNQDHRTSLDLGLGINSRTGLQNISTGISRSRTETIEKTNRKVKVVTASSSSNLSLASVGHTPMVGQAMSNSSLSAKVKAGGTVFGAFGNFSFFGFYNKQKLLNNSIPVANPAYGYLNYEKADESSLLDFNRERDGIIRKESPNLPVPSLTYDIYSVTGQGIAAMYRPIRNDRGQVYDQFTESVSRGASVGGDVGPGGLAHFGVNLSILNATSKSGKWNSAAKNELTVDFKGAEIDDPYEPYFFKAHGESTIEPLENLRDIGGESAVGLRLGNTKEEVSLTAELDARNANPDEEADFTLDQPSPERKIRSQAVSVLTNEELLNGANELLPLFDIADVNGASIQRTSRPVHHIAGLTALNADGLRYTYALPAYNEVNEEYQLNVVNGDGPNAIPTSLDTISVNDVGDEFYSKTEIPQYAHSYLLTSIVGPDYVDRGTIGLDESDIGYWVKFTYSKSTSQFKWRAPFIDANRIEGYLSDNDDDKASLVYGEKEIWYLAKAETKSHIAEFITSERLDGKGVSDREQTTGTALGASLEKLDEIRLYSRASSSDVIKKVIFNHNVAINDNYELCQNVPNSTAGGKLTLKKLHFEFGSSTRGRLTSYKFEYANNIPYQSHAYDRWGNYKEIPSIASDVDDTHNIDLPYTDQNPANRGQLDNFSSSWNLSQIELPSGGEILVDYESDDYGFVQHMPAMQMMEIVDPIPTDPASAEASPSYLLEHDDEGRKIRFKLEQPIPEAELLESPVDHVKRYLDLDRDLYFRVLMNLGKAGVPETDAIKEYVSGYAAIDSDPDKMGLEKVGNQYVYGFFTLKADGDHHPFSKRSWQHIRTNQPELVDVIGDRELEDNLKFFQGLISVIKEVQLLFRGFNKAAEKKDWGEEVYWSQSLVKTMHF